MTQTDRRHALLTLIAAQLELRMAERVLKQYVVAQESHMSAATIRRICRGKDHHISKLVDLADSLGCDVVIEIKPRADVA